MRARRLVSLPVMLAATAAVASDGIEVKRGPDRVEFGSCVPSLTVENASGETIDYLQVDVVMSLSNGQERRASLRSAYRDGVHFPIVPGGKATLKQQLDMEPAIGVPCGEVKVRRVARTLCELAGGKACATSVSVQP